MTNTPYKEAAKKLEITPVERKTGVKQDSWSKVRHIKKQHLKLIIPTFTLDANNAPIQNNNFRCAGVINYSFAKDFRISNYKELKVKVFTGTLEYTNCLICVRFKQDGIIKRYKLVGYSKTSNADYPSDFGFSTYDGGYRTYLSEAWYAGEKVEANFTLEVWRITAIDYRLPANNLEVDLITSIINIPSSLIEESLSESPTQIIDRNDAVVTLPAAFPVPVPTGTYSE